MLPKSRQQERSTGERQRRGATAATLQAVMPTIVTVLPIEVFAVP